jgi:hypothetical protein
MSALVKLFSAKFLPQTDTYSLNATLSFVPPNNVTGYLEINAIGGNSTLKCIKSNALFNVGKSASFFMRGFLIVNCSCNQDFLLFSYFLKQQPMEEL